MRLPHLGMESLDFFTQSLKDKNKYLEFGAGGSTILAAKLGVKNIISVETNLDFLNDVQSFFQENKLTNKFHPVFVDLGKVGGWGRPLDLSRVKDWYKYSQDYMSVLDKIQGKTDFVLIDGRFRVACFISCLFCLNEGVTVMFDDYADRPKYKIIEKLVKPICILDNRAAIFKITHQFDQKLASFLLGQYSVDFA